MLALKSKSGASPGLVEGRLAPCPSSPNCVSSEAGAPESHKTAPLPLEAWDKIPDAIERQGGRIVDVREGYVAAEFSSPLMGFVDDVEFRKAETQVHIRSASRVGYGDMGANRKRVEKLRAALKE
ncbi:DUF1499 domain-containing protein [Marinicaulis flavus]|uniref:DUF1499 domain-containing protein n=2 Tax=Hyphococcus luteus TaxID=2058213 RepID=A0A2S7K9V4_9PROT|nr:DUF1499 domain-containing protein [Marinicaulis flavus]